MKLKTKCYSHQLDAYNHIKHNNFFALYMDMGTGKTRTVLEYIYRKNIKSIIYFCPVSLKYTVDKELNKHIVNPLIYFENGENRIKPICQFYIIGIESINSDRVYLSIHDLVSKLKDYMVIVDESTYIKSFWAKRSHRIMNIGRCATYKCVMTGTPITQYYQDLFMQIKFLSDSIMPYRSYGGFCGRYLRYHSKYKGFVVGTKNTKELMDRITPYIYQVKKKDCIDLPDKIYKNYYYEMSMECRYRYNERKEKFIIEIDDYGNIKSHTIFNLFTDLQKIISDYQDNRFKILGTILSRIVKPIAIYCKFIKEVEYIRNHIDNCVSFTGEVNNKERQKIIDNIDKNTILVMTYGVGSFGLNLTMINNCVHYSNIYKYGDMVQSEDRFHRIGQHKDVTYHKIICSNSIDQRISENIDTKEYILNEFELAIKNKSKNEIKKIVRDL